MPIRTAVNDGAVLIFGVKLKRSAQQGISLFGVRPSIQECDPCVALHPTRLRFRFEWARIGALFPPPDHDFILDDAMNQVYLMDRTDRLSAKGLL